MTTASTPRLIAGARRQAIVDLLKIEPQVTIADLSRRFAISQNTARRDLIVLDANGMINRSHGGAVPSTNELTMTPAGVVPAKTATAQDLAAAIDAAAQIRDDETVFLDASTFAFCVAEELERVHRSIRIVTNGLAIASVLSRSLNQTINVVLTGGTLLARSAFVGAAAEATVRGYFADRAVLRADDHDDPRIATIARAMREQARHVTDV